MNIERLRLASLFAITGVAVAIGVAPVAVADDCDPTATVCQGSDVEDSGPSQDFAPADIPPGGAPSEMEVTEDNPGIASPGFEANHR
jgi:hypothetical protein